MLHSKGHYISEALGVSIVKPRGMTPACQLAKKKTCVEKLGIPIPTMGIGSGHCDGSGSFPKILAVLWNSDILKDYETLERLGVTIVFKGFASERAL